MRTYIDWAIDFAGPCPPNTCPWPAEGGFRRVSFARGVVPTDELAVLFTMNWMMECMALQSRETLAVRQRRCLNIPALACSTEPLSHKHSYSFCIRTECITSGIRTGWMGFAPRKIRCRITSGAPEPSSREAVNDALTTLHIRHYGHQPKMSDVLPRALTCSSTTRRTSIFQYATHPRQKYSYRLHLIMTERNFEKA